MVKFEYCNKYIGENLWKAIMNTGHGCYNPPLVEDWISEQAKSYLEEDYDGEFMFDVFWNMRSLRLIDIFKFEKIDCESGYPFITRTDLDKLIKKYSKNEQVKLKLLELKNRFNENLESERINQAYERASEDFDSFTSDFEQDNDEDVAAFFGISAEKTGVELPSGDIVHLKEVLFCPSCGEPQLISEMEKNYDGISLDEPFDEFMFYCGDCAYGEPMTTKSFILDNPQIDTEFKNKIELKIIANEV